MLEKPALRVEPIQTAHDGVVCTAMRERHLKTAIGSMPGQAAWIQVAFFLPMIGFFVAFKLWLLLILPVILICGFLSAAKASANIEKQIMAGRAELVRGTITKFKNGMVFEIPQGQFLIAPGRGYYKPLQYLCREKPYENEFCIYFDLKTDLPAFGFRDWNEPFALIPFPQSAEQKFLTSHDAATEPKP